MTSKSSKSSGKSPSVKYHHTVNTSDEHEILIDDLFNRDKHAAVNATEKAFDFTSINKYESIYKYGNNSLRRANHYSVDGESKNLDGIEKYIYYTIIGVFYMFLVIFLPFSLFVCLKSLLIQKVKENEAMVVYRLGRLMKPASKPGYCILFPFIDAYQRHSVVPKEFFLPNLQIINHENAIIDLSTRIRYNVKDIVKVTNSLQDLNLSMKSITRGTLVTLLSKKDASKIELEKSYLTQDIKDSINQEIRKWGIELIELEITINSIAKDESEEANSDPALKSISMVFKSLFNSSSSKSDDKPKTSAEADTSKTDGLDPQLFAMLQGMQPFIVPPGPEGEEPTDGQAAGPKVVDNTAAANLMSFLMPSVAETLKKSTATTSASKTESEFSPFRVLKLVEPLINESVVKEIQTVYEFQIRMDSVNKNPNYEESKEEVYHLDLKNSPKGLIGRGPSLFGKADCVIKLNDQDLTELLTDKLKPFTAYMSGRIEIEGDLQDVFKLKKLIKSVATFSNIK